MHREKCLVLFFTFFVQKENVLGEQNSGWELASSVSVRSNTTKHVLCLPLPPPNTPQKAL